MSTEPSADVDIEAVYDRDIPCGWCGKPAQLMSRGHAGCAGHPPPFFKCVACWQEWFTDTMNVLCFLGSLKCGRCKQTFSTIESFSDFRPF